MKASKVTEETLQAWCNQEHILMVDGQHTMENIKVSTEKALHFKSRETTTLRDKNVSHCIVGNSQT